MNRFRADGLHAGRKCLGWIVAAALIAVFGLPIQSVANGQDPSVTTDRSDYPPGATVQITGSGFTPGNLIELHVVHLEGGAPCTCGGEGHDPWFVVSELNGGFTSTWYVNPDDSVGSLFLLTATNVVNPAETASTTFTDNVSVDFGQGANDDGTLNDLVWINGILNAQNSIYFEGMSTFQRIILDEVAPTTGGVHTLTFGHEFTKGGEHAYDWLTSWDQATTAMATALGTAVNQNECGPAIGNMPNFAAICADLHNGASSFSVEVDIPDDPFISQDGAVQPRIDAYEAAFGNRTLTLYTDQPVENATLSLCHTVANGGDTADSDNNYVLRWETPAGADQVTQFGVELAAHLAKGAGSLGDEWGAGRGAASISGGAYHFRLFKLGGEVDNSTVCPVTLLEEASLGNQDNQISSGLVQLAGACCIPQEDDFDVCEIRTANDCGDVGGTYLGDNTSCNPNPCPGACCLPNTGECIVTDVTDCQEQGGEFQGAGTTCDPNPCVPPQGCLVTCPLEITVECGDDTSPAATGTAICIDDACQCTASFEDTFAPGCGGTGVILRVWTCACSEDPPLGLSASCTQRITIVDNTDPTVTCFSDVNLGCNPEVLPDCNSVLAQVTASDVCNTPTLNCDFADTFDGCQVTRTFTIMASDGCNSSSCSVAYTWREDTIPPDLFDCPLEDGGTYDCLADVPDAPEVTAADDCDGIVVVDFEETQSNPDSDCNNTITRTWTATDACGNVASCDQTITVNDTTPPQMTCPLDLTVECDEPTDPSNTGSATATDNCGGEVTISSSDGPMVGGACGGTITRTWTATDDCGNMSECQQIITVADETAPMITCPPDETVECDESTDPSNTGSATATDICDDNVEITFSDEIIGDCPAIIFRDWVATDDCGNTATCLQIITVEDTTAPMITCPLDVTVECVDDVPAPDFTGGSASDNCDADVDISSSDGPLSGDCPATITRTWTATDDCGNTATCVQTITVDDTTAPMITCPPDVTVECVDDVPTPDFTGGSASDNCDADVVISSSDGPLSGDCPATITRTWTATDDCGNTATCVQTITVDDTTAPMITCPPDVTVECVDDVPTPDFTGGSASDNCDADVVISSSDGPLSGDCPATITRTWTATDDCGNTATCVQTITVDDTTAPMITCPPDVTVECVDDVPTPDFTGGSASDNCDADVVISSSDGPLSGDCPATITRTWTATDDCGNTATCVQTITVDDTTAPMITCPPDVTVECVDDVPTPDFTGGSASDNCDADVVISSSDGPLSGDCPATITRTWTATDDCGNTATCVQTITVDDTTAPMITCPPDVTVECVDDVPTPDFTGGSASDNCDADVVISSSDGPLSGDCPATITRTWTATDDCGNTATCVQTITVDDTTAPMITCPPDVTVECVDDVPTPDFTGGSASDNCDADVVISSSDGPLSGDCPATITRTWTATDDCGNTATCVQTITVDDTTAPMITCPPDVTVECVDDVPTPDFTGGSASDNCDADVVISSSDGPLSGDCPATITRTWTATDDCGNTATCVQTITVDDTTAPMITCPPDVTVECVDDVPTPDFTGGSASDNCDADVVISSSDGPLSGDCPATITRTWTATDDCGNTATCVQTITVDDTTAPMITCPPDVTVECVDDVPTPDFTGGSASDNCDDNLAISSSDGPLVGDACDGTITRTWTATDDCGNIASCDQIITVNDTMAPAITCPPDVTVQCEGDVPTPDFSGGSATDNCDADLTINSSDGPLVGGTCGGTITRTWTATDDCGNGASCVQIITLDDDTPPVIFCPPNVSVECDESTEPSNTGSATATDNCMNPIVDWTDSVATSDDCPQESIITRTWTATDDCGNSVTCVQIITVEDTTAPTIVGGDFPADNSTVQAGCDEELMFIIELDDNCDLSPTLSANVVFNPPSTPATGNPPNPGAPSEYSLTSLGNGRYKFIIQLIAGTGPVTADVTLTATDECGNDVTTQATFEADCGEGGEGCTLGYWKAKVHHAAWPAPYVATGPSATLFCNVFNCIEPNDPRFGGKTLLRVLRYNGRDPAQLLAKQTVAALLNAASDVDSDLAPSQVIQMFNDVYPVGSKTVWLALKDYFDFLNNQGCPLGNPANELSGPAGPTPGDIDGDGLMDSRDLRMLMTNWGTSGPGDIDRSGEIDFQDLTLLLSEFGN